MAFFTSKAKKESVAVNESNNQVISYIDKIIGGDYNLSSPEEFENKELVTKLNELVVAMLESNNNFVMRLNDSMTKIGDSSCVKNMMTEVHSQASAINDMRSSSGNLESSINSVLQSAGEIKDTSMEIIKSAKDTTDAMNESISIVDESVAMVQSINDQVNDFKDKAIKINTIIDVVRQVAQKSGLLALNASIEAARAGESGRGFAVVAEEIKALSANTTASTDDVVKYIEELLKGITSIAEQIESTTAKLRAGNESVHNSVDAISNMYGKLDNINDDIESIYNEINMQNAQAQNFIAGVNTIADSYATLEEECMDTGKHLYKISRDIDRARSDMARHYSQLKTLDWITVFEVDHLIFTWRLYNNLAEFESLKITQLNNPKGCKFGKWANNPDNPIAGSKELAKAIKCHDELHKYACSSWEAKDKGDVNGAMAYFEKAYIAYGQFQASLDDVRRAIKATGDTAVTDIKIISM